MKANVLDFEVWVGYVTSVSGTCGFTSNCAQCDPGGRTVCGNVCPSSANLPADAKTYIQNGNFTCAGWSGVIRASYFPAYTQLESLYLSNAGIGAFHTTDKPFKNMPQLKTLTLSHNRIRTFASALVGLSRLEELDLSYNNMPAVANKSFETLTALKKLNVAHNNLMSLNAESLFGLATLTTLTVSDNPISFINKDAFQPLVSIETINMDSMKLSGIVSGLFSQLKNLKHLHISNNSVTSIDDSSLAGTSLDELDLSHNHLAALPVRAIKGCSKPPTSLSLAHNDITSISNAELRDLSAQNLDLSYNQITHIPKDLFLNAPVNNISLRGNPIATIDDGTLDGLTLSAIDLSDTGLTTLSSSTEQGLTTTAAQVNLDNKNWQCDCDAHWLAKLIVMKSGQIVSPTCRAQSQYPNSLLSDAKKQMDIDCVTTTTSTTITTTHKKQLLNRKDSVSMFRDKIIHSNTNSDLKVDHSQPNHDRSTDNNSDDHHRCHHNTHLANNDHVADHHDNSNDDHFNNHTGAYNHNFHNDTHDYLQINDHQHNDNNNNDDDHTTGPAAPNPTTVGDVYAIAREIPNGGGRAKQQRPGGRHAHRPGRHVHGGPLPGRGRTDRRVLPVQENQQDQSPDTPHAPHQASLAASVRTQTTTTTSQHATSE
ncbi:hypothetical protein Btru_050964 [Bulinus truncatus]|nr:hypothetical protein Btru_050964 [Bulinus truncatus]